MFGSSWLPTTRPDGRKKLVPEVPIEQQHDRGRRERRKRQQAEDRRR